MITHTPKPPYYAVIFTSILSEYTAGYEEMAAQMITLAQSQPGFLGIESAREGLGISVSYWTDLEAVRNWKLSSEHLAAQSIGKQRWYASYKVWVAKVSRDYGDD